MNILLVALGSAGDVFPFAGVGVELRRRGHRVTLITNGHFEPLARRLGFEFEPFGSEEDYQRSIRNPDLWHPLKGLKVVGQLIEDQRLLYDAIVRRAGDDTMMVSHILAFAARTAEEKLGLRNATLVMSPAMMRSEHEVPTYLRTLNFSWSPWWFKRLSWWATDVLFIDRILGPATNKLRREVGLGRVSRVFHDWFMSPRLGVGLFADWFAEPQPDWPGQFRMAGFPLWDTEGEAEMPGEVERFLAEGEAPVVFTPGSANIHAKAFFEAGAEACGRLGARGMLLTRHAEQVPGRLPEGVRHFAYAPLSRLLPRCRAIVHHGGVGTTAAGLAGGVAQVIMPLSHDQPDNAARVVRLGVGARVFPRQFRGKRVAEVLEGLLGSGAVAERCRELARRCGEVNGIERAADLIEAAARKSS